MLFVVLCVLLQEKPHTVGDGPRHKDQMSFSPGTQIVNGKRPCSR